MGWSMPRRRIACSTLEAEAACPSAAIIQWIFRCPQAGHSAAYLATTGSISSTTGTGHGPFTGLPARSLASLRV
ncbi:hypothetical protein [Spirillospora sp. NPDC047279]|uniref:hypothetical protein n=1 Tax=Spirillospora sp. NPDC047279 TaxID=3155478 RepID=UPI0033EA9E83